MDRTRQSWPGRRKSFMASISSCFMRGSRVALSHLSAPVSSFASLNTRTILPCLLPSTFSDASKIQGDPSLLVHLLFSASYVAKGLSRTRNLELTRVVMDSAIVLTRKTNHSHEHRTRSSAMEGSLNFPRNRQKLGLRLYDAYAVLNACLFFFDLALPVGLTIARLTSRQPWHSDFALRTQRRPP